MKHHRILSISVVFLIAGLLAPGLAGPSGQASAQEPQLVSGGSAFGTYVSLAGVAQTQRSAAVGMGCAVTPLFRENSAPGVNLPPIGTVGQIHTTAERVNTGSMIRGTTTAEIEDVNLLGGVITADVLKAVAVTRRDDNGFAAHASGTQFVDLNIAGIPIDINPPPNTTIPLPLLGEVVLNERKWAVKPSRAEQQTTMLRISITLPNVLGIPVGTEIIVGSAQSRMKNTLVRLGGGVNGGSVTLLDDTALVGPLYPQGMWCGGTNGVWQTNSGLAIGLPGVLGAGVVENRIKGAANPTNANATGISTIAGVDLLAGLVSANAITGRAHLERTPTSLVRKFWQSEFVDLQVAGFPEINDDVPFDTNLDILGVGDLWLKRRVFWSGSAQIRMIELNVLEDNGLGLPIGASIRVASATVSAKD